jgi:hypothetical protein
MHLATASGYWPEADVRVGYQHAMHHACLLRTSLHLRARRALWFVADVPAVCFRPARPAGCLD